MEKTRVDLVVSGRRSTHREGLVDIERVEHGEWEIDEVPGKVLCRITIKVPSREISMDFIPSHFFCEKLMDMMFQCELENDSFTFSNPKIGRHRTPQFWAKIERVKSILHKWESEGEKKLSNRAPTFWDSKDKLDQNQEELPNL